MVMTMTTTAMTRITATTTTTTDRHPAAPGEAGLTPSERIPSEVIWQAARMRG
jgi:hypothetical protein